MTSSTHNNNDYDPAAAVLLLQQQLLLRDLVLVSAILGIKCAAIAQAIGCLRVTTVQYCAPEDLLLDPPRNRRIRQASRQERNATPTPSSSSSSSSVELTWRERLQRIQQNDVENIPIFLILAAVYSAALITLHNHHHINLDHPASSWMLVEARPVLWVFGGARLLHTLCYLTKLQPHRTLAFALVWQPIIMSAASCCDGPSSLGTSTAATTTVVRQPLLLGSTTIYRSSWYSHCSPK